jgi:hypothetical protein
MWFLTLEPSQELRGLNIFWYFFFLTTVVLDCFYFIAFNEKLKEMR